MYIIMKCEYAIMILIKNVKYKLELIVDSGHKSIPRTVLKHSTLNRIDISQLKLF